MFKFIFFFALALTVLGQPAFSGLGLLDKRPVAEQRDGITAKSSEILSELYQREPEARNAVSGAYGYATFSNFGMKIMFAGGGTGRGIAVRNETGEATFMKMVEVQAGLGMGVKKFKLIWVFETSSAFNQFVNSGWEIGSQASAAAKYKDSGRSYQGAVAIAPGVWLYQLTESGVALELTAKGTKYFKDRKLNI